VPAGGEGGEVLQTLSYNIAHKPATRLTLLVPRSVAAGEMEIEFEGQPISSLEPEASAPSPERDPAVVRFALPAPALGSRMVTIRYPLGPAEEIDASRWRVSVPLVMPGEGQLVDNQLRVIAEGPMTPLAPGSPWTVVDDGQGWPVRRGELALTADGQPTTEAIIELSLSEGASRASTVVQRAWVQSWVSSEVRQDRAVFRFTSNKNAVELIVPDGVLPGQMELLLGQQPVRAEFLSDTKLRIALPGGDLADARSYCLEVRYHLPCQPPRGVATFDLPHLGGDVWVGRTYWELALPPNEHLVVDPAGFTPEYAWSWATWLWQRRPIRDHLWLESWCGATPGTALPEKANRYLFSTAGEPTRCELVTAGRSTILLIASGIVLAAGLLLIYVPWVRHPACLLLAAVALAFATLVAPGPAVLVAQAGSLGLVLALVALMLKRMLAPPPGPPATEPSSSVLDMGSTETQYRAAAAARPPSTENAPTLSGSAADPNS
jgi:hypothetical protein